MRQQLNTASCFGYLDLSAAECWLKQQWKSSYSGAAGIVGSNKSGLQAPTAAGSWLKQKHRTIFISGLNQATCDSKLPP